LECADEALLDTITDEGPGRLRSAHGVVEESLRTCVERLGESVGAVDRDRDVLDLDARAQYVADRVHERMSSGT
jgi:hypothetical protein